MNKITKLAITAVVALTFVSGSVWAWFIAQQKTTAVEVKAGYVAIGMAELITVRPEDKLPGENIWINDVSASQNQIKNTGTRRGVIELTFDESLKIAVLNPDNHVIPAEYMGTDFLDNQADYYIGTDSKTYMTLKRINQVIGVEMVDAQAYGWIMHDNKFYGCIDINDAQELAEIHVTLNKELGGNGSSRDSSGQIIKDPVTDKPVLTPDRQWEHGSELTVGYVVRGVQSTYTTVADVFGDEVADKIMADTGGSWYDPDEE